MTFNIELKPNLGHAWNGLSPSNYPSDRQCDQTGRFLRVLGSNFSYKISPKYFAPKAFLGNLTYKEKKLLTLPLGNFWKKWRIYFQNLVTLHEDSTHLYLINS